MNTLTDYMNESQLTYFDQLLRQEQARILQSIRHSRTILIDNDLDADPTDTAAKEEIKENTVQRVERDTLLLHAIEAALHRIANKTFGFCQETGEPIGIERLMANPTTTLSIAAQQDLEARQRSF